MGYGWTIISGAIDQISLQKYSLILFYYFKNKILAHLEKLFRYQSG